MESRVQLVYKTKLGSGQNKTWLEENSGVTATHQHWVKELEKLATLEKLGKINFLGSTHGSIWTLMKEEVN